MTVAPLIRRFSVAVGTIAAAQVALSRAPLGRPTWEQPVLLFWSVVVAASLCVLGSLAVLWVAHHDDLAEVGMIGAFLYAVSVLPLVHGLTTPGVLYGDNAATSSAVLVAIPVALLNAAPVLFHRQALGRQVLRRWRLWVVAGMGASTALAVGLLVDTELLPAPTMGSGPVAVVAAISLAGCVGLALRHLALAQISRRPGTLAVAAAFVLIGASGLVWFGDRPFNAGFWFAHVLDVVGVLLGCVAAVRSYHLDGSLRRVLGPVTAAEPAAALELGLDPLVHRFVAALRTKDQTTRDHVVRCAQLAVAVGPGLGVRPAELRDLGVAAILHDVGKLSTPAEILTKAEALSDAEWAVMREHAAVGGELVLASPALCGAAPAVRAHHERWDGAGYPDGLAGAAIPSHARIVSVCDAFDAMANARHYRAELGAARALEVLRANAGAQWDPEVVAAVCRHVEQHGVPRSTGALAGVGEDLAEPSPHEDLCGCADAVPDVALATSGVER